MATTDTEVDLALLLAIRAVREAKGACTTRNLAAAMGLTVGGVQHRLAKAEAAGHVEHSDVAGSIRVTPAAGDVATIPLFEDQLQAVVVDGHVLDVRLG